MKVLTAPEKYIKEPDDICVFLAGGITNCKEWQDEVIKKLKTSSNTGNLVIFNPRRENFPIGNPNETNRQIAWEFEMIEKADIFSMYFCNDNSDQPICMYELGRNIVRIQQKYPGSWEQRIIVTVEHGYKREKDVEIQLALATNGKVSVRHDVNSHSAAISSIFTIIKCENKNASNVVKLKDTYII